MEVKTLNQLKGAERAEALEEYRRWQDDEIEFYRYGRKMPNGDKLEKPRELTMAIEEYASTKNKQIRVFWATHNVRIVGFMKSNRIRGKFGFDFVNARTPKEVLKKTGMTVGEHLIEAGIRFAKQHNLEIIRPQLFPKGRKLLQRTVERHSAPAKRRRATIRRK